mmetsp:Transcript_131338/g.366158  ORF Transcript_131338/g.366158 Transcript_131338/m.366158 type:complete len:242 (+) Transcript_131338:153-878(+)
MGNAGCQELKGPSLHKVKLAATPIGPQVPGVPEAYHTSVAIDNVEYSFGPSGLVALQTFKSHYHFPHGPAEVLEIGFTAMTGLELKKALLGDFRIGTYDILRKNCNSFSDCALFYLLGKRLDSKYRVMEQMGASVDENLGLIRAVTMGDYIPNPKAADFEVDRIVERIRRARTIRVSKPPMSRYVVGQSVEVYSATFNMWVGARVQSIHPEGSVTLLYNGQNCKKTVSASEVSRIVRLAPG